MRLPNSWNLNIESPVPTGVVKREWRNEKGYLHREDGPAVVMSNGRMEWWYDGSRHRVGGPAVIDPNGTVEYWLCGERVDQSVVDIDKSTENNLKDMLPPRDSRPINEQIMLDLYSSLVKDTILEEFGCTYDKFSAHYGTLKWNNNNFWENVRNYLGKIHDHEFKAEFGKAHLCMLYLAKNDTSLTYKKALEYGDLLANGINTSYGEIIILR